MKTVKWIKEGDPVPDQSTYLNDKRQVVTRWEADHSLMPAYPSDWYWEYLYEVPITERLLEKDE